MKHSFWGYFVIVMGIAIIVIMLLIQRMTTTTEEDFYLAREVMEAAMIDAVDYGTYRTTGKLVMSEQKFVEVFLRRFSETVTNNKTYQISFYDIYEDPPKATIKIRTRAGTTNLDDESFDINLDTLVTGILETIYSTSNEGKTATKTVTRYITCDAVAPAYYTDGSEYYYGLVRGSTVLIKYDSEKYNNETAGINSQCDKTFNGDQYCKVQYQGSTIYVKRMELMVNKPTCKNKIVTFDTLGGSNCEIKSVVTGSEIGNLCTPTKNGYGFNGWYDQTGCKGNKITESTIVSKDITYYACWTPNKLTLTYDNKGGQNCSTKQIQYNVPVGSLCTPTRSGYTFAGWSNTNGGSVNVNANSAFSKDITIYAVWNSSCSDQNPTACTAYKFCRTGNFYSYTSSAATKYAGIVSNNAKVYKLGEANGLWYVYLDPTVGNYSSYNGSNYVWIYANCLANFSSTTECAAKQCP